MYSSVDERNPVNIPPDTTQKYLVIQEDNNSNSHTHRIRLNITVNNELKGMYYCLIENGQLLLDRNINADHSEYVISLSEKTFKLVNNFTIKYTIDELEIILLFGYKIDCTTWMEYLTAAYVPVQKSDISTPAQLIGTQSAELPPKQPPKKQLQAEKPFSGSPKPLPVSKSKCNENTRISERIDSHLVDLSNLELEKARQTFKDRIKINKEKKNHLNAPFVKEEYHHVPIKSVKTMSNGKRARLLPFHRVSSSDSTDVDDSPFTRSYDSLFENLNMNRK